MKVDATVEALKAGQTIPSPQDPQAYYKLLVGGPKGARIAPGGRLPRSQPASALTEAFREAVGRAGRRLSEARRRLAA